MLLDATAVADDVTAVAVGLDSLAILLDACAAAFAGGDNCFGCGGGDC